MNNEINFEKLKCKIQEIIDSIRNKNFQMAQEELITAKKSINEMIDHAMQDSDLIAISKYQILCEKLQMQLENLN